MSIPANPFAFPSPDDDRPSDGYGMTLRDYVAAKALTGLGVWTPCAPSETISPDSAEAHKRRAKWAYAAADAMLAERPKA